MTVNPEVFFDSEMLGLAENTKTVPGADDAAADAGA